MAPCAHSLCDRPWALVVRRRRHKQRFGHAFLAPVGTRALHSRFYLAISARLGWIPRPCLTKRVVACGCLTGCLWRHRHLERWRHGLWRRFLHSRRFSTCDRSFPLEALRSLHGHHAR